MHTGCCSENSIRILGLLPQTFPGHEYWERVDKEFSLERRGKEAAEWLKSQEISGEASFSTEGKLTGVILGSVRGPIFSSGATLYLTKLSVEHLRSLCDGGPWF